MGITLVQLPCQCWSCNNWCCALAQSPWQQLSLLELQQLGLEVACGCSLCSFRDHISYHSNSHIPAFMKPLTSFWTDAAFLYATFRMSATCHVVTGLPTCCHWSTCVLSLVCLRVVTGLPTCSLIHILNASSNERVWRK